MTRYSHAGGVVARTVSGAREDRAHAWRGYEDALRLLHFEDTRRILTLAHALRL